MARKLGMVAGMALLLVSCTRTQTPDAQGQTHWGQSCDTNADCGEQSDLACICSVCMTQCTRSGDSCDLDGRQAQCFGANAGAVQALCGAARPAAAGVCLESCESECGDGFRCADGACIPIEPQPQPMAGRGAAGGGAAGTGEQDGGQAIQPTPLTIELVNKMSDPVGVNGSEPISVQTKDCSGNPTWFRIGQGGENYFDPFGYCKADCATNPAGPQGCPAICLAPAFETLNTNESIRYEWDGLYWSLNPDRFCANHVALPSGTPLQIEFCWSKTLPREDIPGFPTPPPQEDVVCEKVMTSLGAQATVRFEIKD